MGGLPLTCPLDRVAGIIGSLAPHPQNTAGRSGGQLLVGRLRRRSLDEAGEHDRGRDPSGRVRSSWVAIRPPWENPTAATAASGAR